MKRVILWLAGCVIVVLAGVAFMIGGDLRRNLNGIMQGSERTAYAPPRLDVAIEPGPPQPRVTPDEAGIDAIAIAQAVEYAGQRATRALLIGHGGHIVYEKYWDGADANSLVDASGFTPALAALLAGVALNERTISNIDAPVSNYLPEWREGPRAEITLRHLLGGEAGFSRPDGRPWPGTNAARYFASSGLEATLLGWPIDAAPRRDRAFTSVDADVLALVLRRAFKGRPYETLIADYLWRPLGAGEFSVRLDANGDTPRAYGGCCLRARIGDWMRVGELLANDGVFEGNQFTPPRYVTMMLSPTRTESRVGFFTHVGGTFAARDVAWLEADGKQRLWVVPSLRLVILRVGGEPASDKGWDEAMIPDTIIRATRGWKPAAGEGVDPKLFAPH